ncbi:MAG: response regulator transcription factor [Chitinophagales bacterium]|nr:response regulator transcription factor [Chitinophagales bacterium]
MEIKVIIYDDNIQRLEGLKMYINSTPGMRCVGCFEDCRHVLNEIENTQPNVVLMDIDMPYINGIEGVRTIRTRYSDLKILMQTVFEDDDKVFAAVCAGADGYILKQTDPDTLIAAIGEVQNGGAPMTPTIARKVLQLCARTNKLPADANFDLSRRELEILEFLVKGLSYKMIASECNISYSTVNSHVVSIYKKLQVESVGGAVYKAIKTGLVK